MPSESWADETRTGTYARTTSTAPRDALAENPDSLRGREADGAGSRPSDRPNGDRAPSRSIGSGRRERRTVEDRRAARRPRRHGRLCGGRPRHGPRHEISARGVAAARSPPCGYDFPQTGDGGKLHGGGDGIDSPSGCELGRSIRGHATRGECRENLHRGPRPPTRRRTRSGHPTRLEGGPRRGTTDVGEGRCPCGDRGRRCAGLRATPRLDPYHGRRDRATWETDPSWPSVRYQFEYDRESRPSERRGAGPPRSSVRSPSDLACRAPTWPRERFRRVLRRLVRRRAGHRRRRGEVPG